MAVTAQTPLIAYVASGGAEFTFPFRVLVDDHLKVFVNGTQVTDGYTLEGIGEPGGGTLTFIEPPVAGAKIVLARQVPIARSTDYIEGGALRASVLDDDFDSLVYMIQDIRADAITVTAFQNLADQTQEDAAEAAASAAAALTSQSITTAAASSATASASAAATSASNAASDRTLAQSAATSAGSSASAAATSASTASTAATSATSSQSAAATSATNAATSATAAANSATSAASSASSASTSASNAAMSAAEAAVSASSGVPSGAIAHFARNTPPSGWLKANGALVSRSTYFSLFAAIGTTFGAGDGSTTFALPDLRGEFIRSWDDSRGADPGRAFGTAQADDFKSHTHLPPAGTDGFLSASFSGDGSIDGSRVVGAGERNPTFAPTQATGGTETRPRNVALLACIKF